jgi:hypothetical protein
MGSPQIQIRWFAVEYNYSVSEIVIMIIVLTVLSNRFVKISMIVAGQNFFEIVLLLFNPCSFNEEKDKCDYHFLFNFSEWSHYCKYSMG